MTRQPKTDGENDMDAPGCSKGYNKGGMVTGKHGHKMMRSESHGHKEMSKESKHGHKPIMKKSRGA